MRIHFFSVPYDSGQKNIRMGNGPDVLITELIPELSNQYLINTTTIESELKFNAEIKTSFHLYDKLSKKVSEAIKNDEFPIVFSGNCNAAIGTISALPANNISVIWFDGHADFNTP